MTTEAHAVICIGCKKSPEEIPMYVQMAEIEEYKSATDYVILEEGTYNSVNGHFACDDCYIEMGMPSSSSPNGWVAP